MKFFSKMSLAAVALLSFAGAAQASEHITANGFFGAGTATTAFSSANSIFSFQFDVDAPVVGPYDSETAISNATYSLNNTMLAAPISAIFYPAAERGMFDILFGDGTTISFYGSVIVDAAGNFIENGYYNGAVAVNDAFPATGAGGVALVIGAASPAPEPATWAMMIAGFGMVGFALRRAYRKSEDDFTARVRDLATA